MYHLLILRENRVVYIINILSFKALVATSADDFFLYLFIYLVFVCLFFFRQKIRFDVSDGSNGMSSLLFIYYRLIN